MRLEIGNFHVKDMVFGDATAFSNGVLTINKKEALDVVFEDAHITEAELHIVKPGDMVRITPVKDAFEPRCKVTGNSIFPGFFDSFEPVGQGRTHALKECSVLSVGKHWGCFQDGLIDMGGEFQNHTIFGSMTNLVLVAETDEEFEKRAFQKRNIAHRKAGMRLAKYLGECLRHLEPEDIEVYDLPPLGKRGSDVESLPRVAYIMKVLAQWEDRGYNAEYYGWDTKRILPMYVHPNEILDGAIAGGSFTPASNNMSTYSFQNNSIVKKLMKEHGKEINFLGVILSNETVELSEKKLCVLTDSRLAQALGADGVIISREGYGNADVGFMLTIAELEKMGIKTVGAVNECTGRDGASQPMVLMRKEADALVSTGNVSEILELPSMPVVLGDLESIARDGCGGGWEGCVREDGSLTIEAQAFLDGDAQTGDSIKRCAEF
ncbi:MAG: glycine/sarcosine/betaine reductase component B subunit [Aminobacterium sp.]|jgi:hypothetical protein|uniref:glycine/sarcosine/betaine reductase component B subunit n=1 Tax=Aminobacterium sp. MB27-C1 TaxID=3070661 RepID=UPI001BCA8D20|nr:glycine/sarcosine/betaine reductase component B subunit [Aminobacterium sp. MB27-C1]MDD2206777.1 glycine/sarcosine/betaine reductase component B subunit [Aminobacterium sp.]MDD3427015.1 glycine/sarcosine/betaine reductase component B subunit [Aminobacterium sp.]MDD3708386.1 glycine/sarcosine/betaine reductase component B subunit [Aminobacterium sp.]MDD4229113.1 glycine/sarcosine/betaine reductase component B subunit [Aminobacterium sp.]MDD4552314.1 glycine/sarcosine/betaine reductase compon